MSVKKGTPAAAGKTKEATPPASAAAAPEEQTPPASAAAAPEEQTPPASAAAAPEEQTPPASAAAAPEEQTPPAAVATAPGEQTPPAAAAVALEDDLVTVVILKLFRDKYDHVTLYQKGDSAVFKRSRAEELAGRGCCVITGKE